MARPRPPRRSPGSPPDRPARGPRPPGRVPLAAWVAAVLAAAVAVWRLASLRSHFWAQDDAYISFRYARNLLHGHGLVYNVGERVEGYTNFLWTLLSAIPLALGHADPLPWMNGLSFASLVATYAVLLAFGVALARRGLAMAPLALLPLLFVWSFNLWFLSGMETGLVAAFAIAGTVLVALDPRAHRWAPWGASLCGVLAMLTRADAATVWAALAGVGIAASWRSVPRRTLLVAWLAPVVAIFLPYTIARIAYYGSLYPNTYYAKAIYLPGWDLGARYLATFFSVYPLAWLLAVVPLGAALARDATARRFLAAAAVLSALVLLYVWRVGGDFMEWRFLVPVLGVLLPAGVVAIEAIAARFAPRAGPFAGAAAALGLAALMQARLPAAVNTAMEGQEVIGELARYCDDRQFHWRAVAARLDSLVPPGTKIALTAAGMIPFFCDRPVLDQHGLVDREIAHQPLAVATRGRMGHNHFVQDPAELARRGAAIELVWGAPTPEPQARTLRLPGLTLVSAQIADGRWTSFVVLDTTRFALAPLRRDPRVVIAEAGPPARP